MNKKISKNLTRDELRKEIDRILNESKSVSYKISEIVELNGISMREIEISYGISNSAISRMFNQQNQSINFERFYLICHELNMSLEQAQRLLIEISCTGESVKNIIGNWENETAISQEYKIVI